MKDYPKEKFEIRRPPKTLRVCIDHCLERLYADDIHKCRDEITKNLTYVEIIGALLLARDVLDHADELITITNQMVAETNQKVVDSSLNLDKSIKYLRDYVTENIEEFENIEDYSKLSDCYKSLKLLDKFKSLTNSVDSFYGE